MATEQRVTGKKYRVLADATNRIWKRYSFWTKASDVIFNDGESAEDKLKKIITTVEASIKKYLTASNGKIFQFAYNSATKEYGYKIDGKFNPF